MIAGCRVKHQSRGQVRVPLAPSARHSFPANAPPGRCIRPYPWLEHLWPIRAADCWRHVSESPNRVTSTAITAGCFAAGRRGSRKGIER